GQPCSAFDLAAFSASPPAETWRAVKSAVNVDDATRRVESAPDAPALSGVVESMDITDPELLRARESSPLVKATLEGMGGEYPELLLRLYQSAPGVAHVFVMPMGPHTMVSMRFFLYGD